MNQKINKKNWQCTNGASIGQHTTLTSLQSKSDFPNFILIKNKGESPPGCSRSSGSRLKLHLDINRIDCKDNKSNNKVEIKYNKANLIF